MLEVMHDIRVQGTKPYYEDNSGVQGNFAWVIDGATSLVPDNSSDDGGEVAAFTSNITMALHELADTADDAVDLRELLHDAVTRATRKTGPIDIKNPWEPPSAAMVLAHVSDNQIRLIQSADVAWQVSTSTGVVAESDSERVFAAFEEYNLDAVKGLAPSAAGDAKRRDIFRTTRAKANAAGGYPVVQYGMTSPLAVEETVVQATSPELVLYSDGWPKLAREGLDARLAGGSGGFDDATLLRVRPRT